MDKIKTLIVDDEEHARERLSQMLLKYEDVEILQKCKNGAEAIKYIDELKPDMIFLDVEMPEINGFEVLANIDPENLPIVVFVTAFSEYAVKAFEVNAQDYIHKPFDKKRVEAALEKVRTAILNKNQNLLKEKLEAFLKEQSQSEEMIDRFIVKKGNTIDIVRLFEVHWIEASGNYINIVTENKKHLLRSTLSGVAKRLDPDLFFRIHRSTIVNVDFIDSIEESAYGDYKVFMKNGAKLKMSRNYKELLQSM